MNKPACTQNEATVIALQNLKNAYDDLRDCWEGGNELLDSDISLETYPFAKSFDELGIYSWVNSVIEASNVDIK